MVCTESLILPFHVRKQHFSPAYSCGKNLGPVLQWFAQKHHSPTTFSRDKPPLRSAKIPAGPLILPHFISQQKVCPSRNRFCPARSLRQPVQNPGSGPQGSPPSGRARRPPAAGSSCAGVPCGPPLAFPTSRQIPSSSSLFPRNSPSSPLKTTPFSSLKKALIFYGTFTILGMYGCILHEYWMVQDKIASNQ